MPAGGKRQASRLALTAMKVIKERKDMDLYEGGCERIAELVVMRELKIKLKES